MRTRLFIVPHESGWAVKKPSSPSASKLYKTKREAEAAAREMIARRDGGEIVVHRRDGKITSVDTFTLGEGSFAKVSAVEGVALTREMHRDFRGLDKRRLSPEAGADG
ncbi:MAG: DUF2188 domain-containing protein [Sphingomonadales bacterium]|nr:DUF2188 domain-containing protein [Sphingomonadales bacterium]